MAQAAKTPVDVEKSLTFPVGAFSPLWLAFAGAAATGAAYFWMSRWVRPINLEAKLAADLPAAAAAEPAAIVETVADTIAEAVAVEAEIVETAAETVVEAVAAEAEIAQAAAETLVEAAAEQTAAFSEAMAQVDPVVDAALAVADDLTRLVGIGPKLASALAERGVTRFAQLAAWTPADLEEIDQALSLKGRAVRDAWVAQARRFAEASA